MDEETERLIESLGAADTRERFRERQAALEQRLFSQGYQFLYWKPYIRWPKWVAKLFPNWGYWKAN